MKYIVILITIIVLSFSAHSQSFQWAYTLGYSGTSHPTALKKDHVGFIYLSIYDDSMGHVLNTNIEKRDVSQNVFWNLSFPGGTKITDIEINSLNHPVFTGYYQGTMIAGNDTLNSPSFISSFIIETDENGNYLWAVSFNPNNGDFMPVDLFIDRNDNIYMTAQISSITNGFASFHKLDLWGTPVHDEFNGNTENRTYSHIYVDSSGSIYISGTCGNGAMFDTLSVPNFSYQNMLVKYDPSFNAEWVVTRKYITFDDNNGLGSDGEFLYWAFVEATSGNDTVKLAKVDFAGQVLLEVPGPLQVATFPSITIETDENGHSLFVENVFTRLYVYHLDDQLIVHWSDSLFAHVANFPLECPIAVYDSSFFIASQYYGDTIGVGTFLLWNPNSPSDPDVFLAKWGYANTVSVSMAEAADAIRFYPNPIGNFLKFNYKENRPATLSISDSHGKIIQSRIISDAGMNEIDVSGLSNGIYFLTLTNKSSVYSGKIVIQN